MKYALIVTTALFASACTGDDWGPEQLGEGRTSHTARTAELGRELYGQYCVGCHGENGDGAGPAARFLDPKPRDFRLGRLKFAGVQSGDPPRDEDYLRTIEHGLRGTAMPSFALLSLDERRALVAYIREFIDPTKRKPPGDALAIAKNPWAKDPRGAVEMGKRVYHTHAKCWSCHPVYASQEEFSAYYKEAGLGDQERRPDPSHSVVTESSWGAPIRAPNFLVDRVKTGFELEGLVRVIQAGVGGTAMPTWAGALKPKELWGLAYYIRSLALKRGTPEIMHDQVPLPEAKP
jgi:mono/diheme cytochrome c family protein